MRAGTDSKAWWTIGLAILLLAGGLVILYVQKPTVAELLSFSVSTDESPPPPSFSTGIHADWKLYDNSSALTRKADLIVFATVTTTEPAKPIGSLPYTLVHLRVDRVLKGPPASTITVVQTGGTYGDKTVFLDGDPRYLPGDRYLLFLLKGSNLPGMEMHNPEYLDKYLILGPQARLLVRNGQLVPQLKDDKVSLELMGLDERQAAAAVEQGK